MNKILATVILAALLPAPAGAADMPDAAEIAGKLAAPPAAGLTRSFQPRSADGRGISMTAAAPEAPPAIDLSIGFEFNSAELTPDGRILVGNLGRALKDPRLAQGRFRLEGHTDAKGGEQYNQALSERRAEAVRRELVVTHAADPGRLDAVGLGKGQLLDPANPESGVNRRVRVVNLGER